MIWKKKILFAFCLSLLTTGLAHAWQELEEGLWLKNFTAPRENTSRPYRIHVLRVDLDRFLPVLCMASRDGDTALPQEWAARYDMVAVINASMYTPDQRTSAGYMKSRGVKNNGYINPGYGAFLLFDPLSASLPPVQMIDRNHSADWRELLDQYGSCIQNFRLVSREGENVWHKDSEPTSIAAVGMNDEGELLLIHSILPLSVQYFVDVLLSLPLRLSMAMYVEGGVDASLHIRTQKCKQIFSGTDSRAFWIKSRDRYLPNVLGIVRKKTR